MKCGLSRRSARAPQLGQVMCGDPRGIRWNCWDSYEPQGLQYSDIDYTIKVWTTKPQLGLQDHRWDYKTTADPANPRMGPEQFSWDYKKNQLGLQNYYY